MDELCEKTAHLLLVVFQEKLGYQQVLKQGIIMVAIVCEAAAEEMGGFLVKG